MLPHLQAFWIAFPAKYTMNIGHTKVPKSEVGAGTRNVARRNACNSRLKSNTGVLLLLPARVLSFRYFRTTLYERESV